MFVQHWNRSFFGWSGCRIFGLTAFGQLIEGFTGSFEHGGPAVDLPKAFERDIDVPRIKLDSETAPADAMCGDKGGARAKKRIEHDIGAMGQIEDGIRSMAAGFTVGWNSSPCGCLS